MGLNLYYNNVLQPKMSAGIINEHECTVLFIINDTKQKSHFKNQRDTTLKHGDEVTTLTTNLQLLLYYYLHTFFRFCHQTGTNSVFLV